MSCFNVKFSGQTDITFEISRNKAYYIRYLKFSACSRCFCSYLLVLDVFRFLDTWHAASVACKLVAKIVENWIKLMPKSFKIHRNSIPSQPKWCPGALRKRPWEQVGSRNNILEHHRSFGGCILSSFCRRLGDFGHHFGHRWAPRVSQNRTFWHQEPSKVGKKMFRKGCWKKHENIRGFCEGKWRLGGWKIIDFSLFFNRIVLSALFEKS